MEFFPHIDIMVAESSLDHFDRDAQGFFDVNTYLNLFNNWLLGHQFTFTLPLEKFICLHCCNRTTFVSIKVSLGFNVVLAKVQHSFLAWIRLSLYRKTLGGISSFKSTNFCPQHQLFSFGGWWKLEVDNVMKQTLVECDALSFQGWSTHCKTRYCSILDGTNRK